MGWFRFIDVIERCDVRNQHSENQPRRISRSSCNGVLATRRLVHLELRAPPEVRMKDVFGYTLNRLNTIAYISRQGSNVHIRRGQVQEVSDKECVVMWNKEFGYAPKKNSVLKTPGLIVRIG